VFFLWCLKAQATVVCSTWEVLVSWLWTDWQLLLSYGEQQAE
jgi:hypothetical protein